ncbi:flagellar basal body rod protein FlgG [Oceanobacillus sp. CAU 1775]
MLRSMYAGISGMKNFQTKLDVIGNNIANVSTSGFKKGRVTFQDMMSQTTAGAQGPTATRGGVNASQVGLGSQMGTIDNIHTQGFRQTTNNPLDFAIQGDGMFALVEGDVTNIINSQDVAFSRAGNFYLDQNGNIVNPQGLYLVGYQEDPTYDPNAAAPGNPTLDTLGTITIPRDAQSFNIESNGLVTYINNQGDFSIAGQVALVNFSNPAGLEKIGDNLYNSTPNAGGRSLEADGTPTQNEYFNFQRAESDGLGSSIISNSLEMSNVDLAEEFTEMITAQRGFQANTRIITTSDEILQELVNLKR